MESVRETCNGYTTDKFRMGGGAFAAMMFRHYGHRWAWAFAILCLAAGVAAFFDLRWGIVVLMIVFLIIPMAMAFMYFNYGLQPVNAFNTLPHTVTLKDAGLIVEAFPAKGSDDDTDDAETSKTGPSISRTIPYYRLGPVKAGLSSVVITVDGKPKTYIWLPPKAFENDRQWSDAVKYLISKL